jgi:hypothetical protein
VTLPQDVVVYDVRDDRITGFRTIPREGPARVPATGPRTYLFSTLSEPNGERELVQIAGGPLEGLRVSPDDPGVAYTPQ